MQQIIINPLDTIFIKDGRPFSLGDENAVGGIFPPPPSVFYGALRSNYLGENPNIFPVMSTENDPTASLKINQLSLIKNDKPYFPAPFDIVEEKGGKNPQILYLKENTLTASFVMPHVLVPNTDQPVESVGSKYFFGLGGLIKYLHTGDFVLDLKPKNHFWINEPKVGIGRNRLTGTTEEGQLYRINMIRPFGFDSDQITGFLVTFNGLSSKNSNRDGFLKLGAEAKTAAYKSTEDNFSITPPEFNPGEKLFKLFCSTPSFFTQGLLPSWINPDDFFGKFNNLKLQLVTISSGRFLSLGGFDMKKREPKPMRRAVPAGSVYYFKLLDGSMDEVISAFHGKSISEFDSANEGFGIVYVGKVKI